MEASSNDLQFRKETARWMRRLYKQGLTTCSGGNVSMRHGDLVFITASQTDKAVIKANQICVITIDGNLLTSQLKPSMETGLHLAIYKSNSEIRAIIHAHPKNLSVLACADVEICNHFTGEQRYVLGIPAVAPYHLMGSDALAKATAEVCKSHHAVIMRNHGAICTGKSLFQAFDRMEVFEALAYQTLMLHPAHKPLVLSADQLTEIDRF